jgi:hypothetical protein
LETLDGVIMGWLDWLFGRRVSTDAATLATRQSLAETPTESIVMGQFPNLSPQVVTTATSMSATRPSVPEPLTESMVTGQSLNFLVNTVHLPPHGDLRVFSAEEMRAIAARNAEEQKAIAAAKEQAERISNVRKYPRTRDNDDPNYAEANAVAVHIAEYPMDRYFTNLCEEFRNAELARQRAIVAEYAACEELLIFALRMANKAIREQSAECVLNGMTALCIESEEFDPRENAAYSEVLRDAAESIGPEVLDDCYSRIAEIAKQVPCCIGALTHIVNLPQSEFDDRSRWLCVKVVAGFRQFVWFA